MAGFLESNLDLIHARGFRVDPEWLQRGSGGTAVETAETKTPGSPNFIVRHGGAAHPLYSAYNPPRDAAMFAKKSCAAPDDTLLLPGFGGGYVAEALADLAPDGRVIAFEFLPELLRAALATRDFTRLFTRGNFELAAGPWPAVQQDMLDHYSGALRSDASPILLVHHPYIKALPPHVANSFDTVSAFLSRYHLPASSFADTVAFKMVDEPFRKRITGEPFSDTDRAALFAAALHGDHAAGYFAASYERRGVPRSARNILVIQLSSIGDVIAAAPAFAALRAAYPGARLCLLTETPSNTLFGPPDFDRVFSFSRQKIRSKLGLPLTAAAIAAAGEDFKRILDELRGESFDLVVNLHTSARSAIIASALGAEHGIGFFSPENAPPAMKGNLWHFARTRRLGVSGALPAEQFLCMLDAPARVPPDIALASVPDGYPPDLAGRRLGAGRPLVGINPFSNYMSRRWEADSFIETGRALAARFDARLIVFSGPAPDEKNLASRIAASIGGAAFASLGDTLPAAAALMARCDLVITCDSGLMHLAGAAGAPVLTVCGPTLGLPFGPPGCVALRAVLDCTASCGPLSHCERRDCMKQLPAGAAVAVAKYLLGEPKPSYAGLAGLLKSVLPEGAAAATNGFTATALPMQPFPCTGRENPAELLLDKLEAAALGNLYTAASHLPEGERFSEALIAGAGALIYTPCAALDSLLTLMDGVDFGAEEIRAGADARARALDELSHMLRDEDYTRENYPAAAVARVLIPLLETGFSPGEIAGMAGYVRDFVLQAAGYYRSKSSL